MIDCHVHCRDWEQSYKETIGHVLRVGEHLGFSGVFDMPNTAPSIDSNGLVRLRLQDAEKCRSNVFYGLHMGLTSDGRQIEEAVKTYEKFFPGEEDRVGVVGFKMFAGKSVGDLTVANEEGQREVYRTLRKLGYTGVLTVHCEKESLMKEELWDAKNPITHSYARPELAETESVSNQIRFAIEENYKGKLHIPHITTHKSVSLINNAKPYLDITCGVTPAHLLINREAMNKENGIMLKVNPPLRKENTRADLFEDFLEGQIDVLESDHAPHSYEDKTEKHMSGNPNFPFLLDYVEVLKDRGASAELLEGMLHDNVNRIWGLNLPKAKVVSRFALDENFQDFYCFNPLDFVER